MVTSPDAPEIHTYIEISLEHLIFQAVLHRSWSRRNCMLITHSLNSFQTFCIKKIRTNFLCQPTILDFAFCFFFIECNGKARRWPAKECWGPCHGLIPSLWDFAQNYSLQIELQNQNWRGTFHSLDFRRWRRPSMLSSMCQHVARLHFDSCIEKDSLCGTVMRAWT